MRCAYFGWAAPSVKITVKRRNTANFCIFRTYDIQTDVTLDHIWSLFESRPFQHIYMYRCKNDTIRFIKIIFKMLNSKTPDKGFNLLECNAFQILVDLNLQTMCTPFSNLEIGEANGMEDFYIKVFISLIEELGCGDF